MFKKLCVIPAIALICTGIFQTADAREKIVWPYICFPPTYICEKDKCIGGIGWKIYQRIWKSMPEYEHESILLPIKRIIKNMQQGKHYLFYGLYKTPEREKRLYFSVPCRIEPPLMVVVRKSDFKKFGGGEHVSFEALLKDTTLKTIMGSSVSYGAVFDALFKKYEKSKNLYVDYRTDELGAYSLDLLLKKRIDYYISTKAVLHISKEKGIADQIAYIPVKEQNVYQIGYITAPKNEWGKRMLKKVNRALRKLIPTEAYFKLFTPLVGENMVPELRRQFNALILEPSKRQNPGW